MAAVDDSAACQVDSSYNYATLLSAFGMKLHRDAHQIQINLFQTIWNALIQMNQIKKKYFSVILFLFSILLISKWVLFSMSTAFIHCSVCICLGLTWWNSIGLFIRFVIYLHLDSSDKRLLIALGVRLWHHKSVKTVFVHTQPHSRCD